MTLSSEPHPEFSLCFWGPFLKKDVGDKKKIVIIIEKIWKVWKKSLRVGRQNEHGLFGLKNVGVKGKQLEAAKEGREGLFYVSYEWDWEISEESSFKIEDTFHVTYNAAVELIPAVCNRHQKCKLFETATREGKKESLDAKMQIQSQHQRISKLQIARAGRQ